MNQRDHTKKRRNTGFLFRNLLLFLVFFISFTMTGALADTNEDGSAEKLSELVLVGPPGPMAIPLAYLAENNKLADIADSTTLTIWENTDQLKAIMGGGTLAHFVTMPSNSAATFYNKGIGLQALDISTWGILYVISTDPSIQTFEDLKGKEIVIPFEGGMPDLLFSSICKQSGIDSATDLTIYYANTPQQAATLLLSGEKDCAILTEPLVTQVLMKGKQSGVDFTRSLDLQEEWGRVTSLGDKIPIAGTVALASIQDNPNAINRFMEEYSLAVDWIRENPDEAGLLGSQIKALGFEAKPVSESVKNTRWDFIPTSECQNEIEAFFTVLSEKDPKIIGGKLPDEGFYYNGFSD